MFTNLWFDLKYASRLLFKTPGYSLLCVIVVALSVGLTVWAYEVVYSVALKPLPFAGAERWYSVQIAEDATATAEPDIDAYTYQKLLSDSRTADHLGAFSSEAAVLSEGQASTSLRSASITPALLSAMNVAPLMGRLFDAADSEPGAPPAVILSYDTWQNYFAAEPAIVGKQTRIDGRPVQIVGVMPDSFFAFRDFELWRPLRLDILARPEDSTVTLAPLIVLGEDQSLAAVSNELNVPVAEINRIYPQLFDAERHVELIPAHVMSSHDIVPIVAMVSFVALAVLLLGCVNISMVFFARLLERSRELALRSALGAPRWRLLRQCLLETVFVVLLGLVIAIVLALLGIRWGQGIADFPAQVLATGRAPTQLDVRAGDLVVAIIAATVLWLLATVIPAWRITKQDAAMVLSGSGKGVATASGGRSAAVLVGLQVVVACLVLVICANLVFAVRQETSKPSGLSAAQTSRLMISTYPTQFGPRYAEASERLRYWDELTGAIEGRMTGAEVAYVTAVPTRPNSVPAAIENQEGQADRGELTLPVAAVSDNYFELLGLRLRSGRLFDATDNSASLGVAVIDENTARRYWPGQDPLGKRFQLNPKENGPQLTIVGVVSYVGGRPYSENTGVVYQSLRQATPAAFQLLVQLPAAAADSRATLRAAAFAVDSDMPLHNLQMLDDYLKALNLDFNAMGSVFNVIAAITVILAASGLFGLIVRSVARRTQEVGVRRALGSTQSQVTALFLRQALPHLCVGILGGFAGVVLTNLLSALIPNILGNVLVVSLGVFLLMAVVILTASYLPTRRAVALEPGDALRYE